MYKSNFWYFFLVFSQWINSCLSGAYEEMSNFLFFLHLFTQSFIVGVCVGDILKESGEWDEDDVAIMYLRLVLELAAHVSI